MFFACRVSDSISLESARKTEFPSEEYFIFDERMDQSMGQYYLIVNLDKKEFLRSHDFGDGAKLLEFGCSANGMMTGLAILLADGNGRGGGDLYRSGPVADLRK